LGNDETGDQNIEHSGSCWLLPFSQSGADGAFLAANTALARLSSRYPAITTIVYGRPGREAGARDKLKEICPKFLALRSCGCIKTVVRAPFPGDRELAQK